MPYKDREKQLQYFRDRYQKNKEKMKEQAKIMYYKNRDHNLKRMSEYQKNLRKHALHIYDWKCQECGIDCIIVLQWHHIDGNNEFTRKTLTDIIKANKKLDNVQLLCANCHILADLRDGTSNRNLGLLEIHNEVAI